jgi:hypothetical protein
MPYRDGSTSIMPIAHVPLLQVDDVAAGDRVDGPLAPDREHVLAEDALNLDH